MHHPEPKNESASFFKRKTRPFVEQQRQFQQLMAAPSDQRIVLSSLKQLMSLCPPQGSHLLWQKAL